jgi:SAM-dependent methyltransferase
MSQRHMEAHDRPNWDLTQAHGLLGYNCGYAQEPGAASFNEHQQALVWRLIGDTPIGHQTTVLDVGCGIGGPSGWIFERFQPARLVGLEYVGVSARAAHDRWHSHTRRPSFIQGDAHRLPVESNSVDVIFNLESALHYADKNAFIAECSRVLRPGGTLCLGDITTNLKVVFSIFEWLNHLPSQFNSNVHLWSGEDYTEAFERHGLSVLWHEEASREVSNSLQDGRMEMRCHSFRETLPFRGRMVFLHFLENYLRAAELTYDLFRVRKSAHSEGHKAHAHH